MHTLGKRQNESKSSLVRSREDFFLMWGTFDSPSLSTFYCFAEKNTDTEEIRGDGTVSIDHNHRRALRRFRGRRGQNAINKTKKESQKNHCNLAIVPHNKAAREQQRMGLNLFGMAALNFVQKN